MYVKFCRLMDDERGATAIEYSLIAAATGLGIAALMPSIKTNLQTKFNALSAGL